MHIRPDRDQQRQPALGHAATAHDDNFAPVQAQTDELVLTVVKALDGVQEAELVTALLRLRTALEETSGGGDAALAGEVDIEAAKTQVVNLINTFFRDRLTAVPSIKSYMDTFAVSGSASEAQGSTGVSG